jgi:DNA-binding response OmpR family regulator
MGSTPPRPLALVVEDDADLLEALCESLRLEGVECAGARSGERALDLLRTLRPDVILLDLRMPEMDGLEFLRRRRAIASDGCPVVVLTGDDALASEAAELGAVASVRKPVRIEVLLDTLMWHARRSGSGP